MNERHRMRPDHSLCRCFFIGVFFLSLNAAVLAGVSLDGTLDPAKTGAVGGGTVNGIPTDYLISQDLGQTRNGNLFHSFSEFNIDTGKSATFTSDNINNIICRITGGASSIDGLIRSWNSDGTLSDANLFLLNPMGIMFGPGARLDIGGSFHASTADYLKLGGGGIFYADPAQGSVLSVADPVSFGFLNAQPATITLDRAILRVPAGETISIIGGDIQAANDPTADTYYDETFYLLSAPGGRINLFSAASAGEVDLTTQDMGFGSFSKLGNITLSNGANLDVSSSDYMTPGGTVFIRGGQIMFNWLNIDALGSPEGSIDIQGESLTLDMAMFQPLNVGETDLSGPACSIDLSQDLVMKNMAMIDTSNFGGGSGGDIRITTGGSITLGDDAPGTGPGAEGGYYGRIQSASWSTGKGGSIDIATPRLIIRNGFAINTAASDAGDAGDITVQADDIQLLDMGNMCSNGVGFGSGGTVDVTADTILFSGANEALVVNSSQVTGISAQSQYDSNGGKIIINADDIQILDGGKISSMAYGTGQGASVEISARNILVSGYVQYNGDYYLSAIDGRVSGDMATGTGGSMSITADSLTLTDGGAIRTNLYENAPGNAGGITINAGSIDIRSRGQIYADSFRGTGNSGNLHITAGSLNIAGAGDTPTPAGLDFDFTGLSTATSSGLGGTIYVNLTGDLTLADRGGISAGTQGTGPGGAVNITAHRVVVGSRSAISTASTGTGNAGDIAIAATDEVLLDDSSITTEAMLSDGGNISIHAPYMVKLEDSQVTASVGGGPLTTGGNIDIDPQYVILKNGRIVANAYEGTGGNINLVADTFLADPDSVVDASSALGISGTVDIQANITNVNGLLSPLTTEFTSAAALLREPCLARLKGGKYSSFIIRGREGLPLEPGGLLPSRLP